jgi:hypothetical protein
VLFRADLHEAIRSGVVTVAFRSWKRPTVAGGGTLRSPVGVLRIDEVTPITRADVTPADARSAGFGSVEAVFASLAYGPDRQLYRIRFRLEGADPRIALRSATDVDEGERARIDGRLDRCDRAADEPWTRPLLDLIAQHPGVRSLDLAPLLGLDQQQFKRRVRQLKELGLTESLGTGYRLSPRGRAYWAR